MAKCRPAIPTAAQTELLTQSRRRCCLCFGLKGDIEVKDGQIAHLDRNSANNRLDNLVWLCLSHHDDYDSVRRQTKRLTAEELKIYRSTLYAQLARILAFTPEDGDSQNGLEEEKDIAIEIIHRYSDADKATVRVIEAEILTRIEQVYQFYRTQEAEIQMLDQLSLSEDDADSRNWEIHHRVREQLGLPHGIHALGAEGPLTALWRQSARRLAKLWIAGKLSYEQCIDVLWILDEQYDLDPHYILFGLPNESMTRIQMRALKAFIFEHGPRRFVRTHVQIPGNVPF